MTLSPAAIELSRRNLLAFTAATYPEYQIGWVHREICAKLMDFYVKVKRKQSPRLIITMPPRHGKSELVSRRFPAWCLGLDPNLSFISATYAADLAESMNSDVQKIINRGEYRQIFPWTTLQASRKKGEDTYKKTTTLFEIPGFRGGLRSAGVNGGINGQGADILSLDDLYKNRQEADSLTHRDSVMYWYTSTAYTRLAPGGGVLLTVTRWHEDDIVGRLVEMMKGGGDQWNIINYPAIAECDELHRKEGEALHPERYSVEALNRIRIAIGDYDFGSLYQQHPSPRGGSIFKRDRFMEWKTLPRIWDKIIQSWDCSFKEGKKKRLRGRTGVGQGRTELLLAGCHSREDGLLWHKGCHQTYEQEVASGGDQDRGRQGEWSCHYL